LAVDYHPWSIDGHRKPCNDHCNGHQWSIDGYRLFSMAIDFRQKHEIISLPVSEQSPNTCGESTDSTTPVSMRTISCHKNVLRASSNFFDDLFANNFTMEKMNVAEKQAEGR